MVSGYPWVHRTPPTSYRVTNDTKTRKKERVRDGSDSTKSRRTPGLTVDFRILKREAHGVDGQVLGDTRGGRTWLVFDLPTV